MLTTTYRFEVCPGVAVATFDCPSCGKAKRKRTFRAECTVSPFNKNPDGSVKTRREVYRQSAEQAKKMRDDFMRKPLCKTCEDALSNPDQRALRRLRTALSEAVQP